MASRPKQKTQDKDDDEYCAINYDSGTDNESETENITRHIGCRIDNDEGKYSYKRVIMLRAVPRDDI